MTTLKATFFATQTEFRDWLEKNHLTQTELLVGYYKVGSKKPSMTWPQSVDQALCFGWIDGVRRTIDSESYCIRFTPRRPNSIWSEINIKKIEKLSNAGLMKEAGLKAYSFIIGNESRIYSYEKEPSYLTTAFEQEFKSNPIAWEFFNLQAPSYKKVMIHWIMSAIQEKTQISRLQKTIDISSKKERMQ